MIKELIKGITICNAFYKYANSWNTVIIRTFINGQIKISDYEWFLDNDENFRKYCMNKEKIYHEED